MRQLIKISFITLAAGALFWAPLQAMPVGSSDAGVNIDISGFAGAATSSVTPYNEDAPGYLATTVEARMNVTAGTDKMSVQMSRWIRESNAETAIGFNENPYQFAQLTWKPIDALRIDAGSMVYLPWTDRAIQWEWFAGVGPLFPSGDYTGYIENVPGIDVSYDVGGGIEVGLGIMTTGVVSGTATDMNNGSGPPATESTGQTTIVHLIYAAGPLAARVSLYSEAASTTTDSWATQTDTSDTLTVIDVKFQYDDAGSYAKLDYISADGDSFATTNNVLAVAVSHKLGDDAVFLEYESDTASGGVDGIDQTYMRVGYSLAVAAGSDVRFTYEAQDNGQVANNAASAIGLTLFQSF